MGWFGLHEASHAMEGKTDVKGLWREGRLYSVCEGCVVILGMV